MQHVCLSLSPLVPVYLYDVSLLQFWRYAENVFASRCLKSRQSVAPVVFQFHLLCYFVHVFFVIVIGFDRINIWYHFISDIQHIFFSPSRRCCESTASVVINFNFGDMQQILFASDFLEI